MNVAPATNVKPWVIGHRGNTGNPLNGIFVENTEASIGSAISLGVTGVEFDIIRSKDGKLTVHHDDTFGRVFASPDGDDKKLVSSYTWGEISKAKFNPACLRRSSYNNDSELKIPTIEDLPTGDAKLFIELKFNKDLEPQNANESDYLDRIAKDTVDFIRAKGLKDRAYVLSFVPSALDRVREYGPEITTVYNIYQHEPERNDVEKLLRALRKGYGFDVVNPPIEQTTPHFIQACHNLGLRTYPWVWNQDASTELIEFERLLKLGVDGIITNQPLEGMELVNRLFPPNK